jgi:hypothetical protein
VPRSEDLLKLGLSIWFSVLAALELHSLLAISELLGSVSFCDLRDGHSRTALEKYHALDISGTSGRMKKPAMAIGSEITPSIINSLQTSAFVNLPTSRIPLPAAKSSYTFEMIHRSH